MRTTFEATASRIVVHVDAYIRSLHRYVCEYVFMYVDSHAVRRVLSQSLQSA